MPKVSVILPVYNGERFLREAINSLLAQTFTDFELLILNDGSTDGSEAIIKSYADKRIVSLKDEKNSGLIFTLNKGMELARGEYVARMDADDVCFSERLQTQAQWLDQNPQTAVVASYSVNIDEDGNEKGYSLKDRRYTTANEIRRRMPVENCLSHPTVMGRARVLKAYKYIPSQLHMEDYDLWLRLLADGNTVQKIPKPLLYYRVHQSSVTQSKLRRNNFFRKYFQCKKRYLAGRIKSKRFNAFDLQVAIQAVLDLGRAAGKSTKRFFLKK